MRFLIAALLFSFLAAGCAPENVDWSNRKIDVALVQSDNGTLKTPLNPEYEAEMDFTFQVPYARVTEPFRKIAHRKFLNLLRTKETSVRLDRSVPVYDLQLPNYSGASLQYAYAVSPLATQVVALREKNRGVFRERDLQTNQIKTRTSSRVFGKDLSLRYLATAGGAGAFGLCLNLPGESIGADPVELQSTAQELHEPYRTASFKVKSETVAATFDFARACFALPIGARAGEDASDLETKIAAPQAMGPVIASEFGELIEPLKGFYAKKYAKDETDEVSEKAKNFLDGSWILGERTSYLNQTGQSLRDDLDTVFHRIAIPENPTQLKQVLVDTCRRMKFAEDKTYTSDVDSFCRNEVDTFQVKSLAVPDTQSQKSGCYKGFARIHEKSRALTACQVEVQLHISMKDKNDRKPLATVLKAFVEQPAAPWENGIHKLGLDPLELTLLLEEWENEGHAHIEQRNWMQDFPKLIEDIRTELAKD